MNAPAQDRLEELYRARPRRWLHSISVLIALALVAGSFASPELGLVEFIDENAVSRLPHFLARECVPFPMRSGRASFSELRGWLHTLTEDKAAPGVLNTLAITTVASALAAALAFALAPFAARNFATSRPFALVFPDGRFFIRAVWRALRVLVRALFILLRAVPEYLWAFLLLAILGPSAWPAILALALHNAGILGRLGAETLENMDQAAPRSLRGLGASRAQMLAFAALPMTFNRALLYFFERFETCLREATVLGMLGIVSLGYYIEEARSRLYYDEMIFLVLSGMLLILLVDLCSWVVRSRLRRA